MDENKPKFELQEILKQLAAMRAENSVIHRIFISSQDRHLFEGTDSKVFPGKVEIISSPFLKKGEAYRVEAEPRFSDFKFAPEIFERVGKAFDDLSRQFFLVGRGFQTVVDQVYQWRRRPGEGVLEWGTRLGERGLLDDPNIRWEFQKAVFKSIGLAVKRIVLRRRV